MGLFERIIPLQEGKNSKGEISRALGYEKRSQGFELRKDVKMVTKPWKRNLTGMRQVLAKDPFRNQNAEEKKTSQE